MTLVRYIRFNAKDQIEAKYPYIYVKMETTITRKQLATNTFGTPISNYWYKNDMTLPLASGKDGILFDAINPYDGGDINSITRGIETTLVGNTVETLAGKNYKYFFVPKTIELTAQDGDTYVITTSGNGANHDKVVCKYDALHTHPYADFANAIKVCAINYGAGAFNNGKLYAVKKGSSATPTEIAVLNQTSGIISLTKNAISKKLLNAKGYDEPKTLTDELSAYVGVVASSKTGCNLAEVVEDGSFIVSWERPINLISKKANGVIDAKTNGNVINFIDNFKFYDWRGVETKLYKDYKAETELNDAKRDTYFAKSKMWGENLWFWAYYGINSITVDYSKIETTLNNGSNFVPLSSVSNALELYFLDANGAPVRGVQTYSFNLSSYNSEAKNAALQTYMNANKALFGRILYTNNGDVVKNFSLKIPVTIGYTWGHFNTEIILDVQTTIGH